MTVKQRQNLLAYLDYYIGAIDGDWGSGSREACKAFQRTYNDITGKSILEDGYGGPETDKALRYAVANDLMKTEPVPEVGTDLAEGTELELLFEGIRYWSPEEFRCRCGEYHEPYCNGFPVLPDRTLLELVDDLRHDAGRPAHRSSAIRCYQHNIDSNGVANSRHLRGKALDFFIEGMTGAQLLAAAQADPRTRYAYIIDGQWVHVDVA